MLNQNILDEIGAKIRQILAQSPARDIETNVRAMLSSTFTRLDLVSRQEFDVQTDLLVRTREKLSALEARLAEIEKRQTGEPAK
jgi:BMFP domain-containing protein YqiC